MISRCSAISRARTCGTRATAETALVTSWLRTAAVTSWPSTRTHGPSGSVPTSMLGSPTAWATAAGSSAGMPRASIHQVSARYMEPVSR